jgi:hypothetical protein
LDKALRIASKAADRVEDQIGGANITQATVAFGVATEKIMLLLSETGGGVPVQVNLQVNAQALHERYAEMVRRLEAQGDSLHSKVMPQELAHQKRVEAASSANTC